MCCSECKNVYFQRAIFQRVQTCALFVSLRQLSLWQQKQAHYAQSVENSSIYYYYKIGFKCISKQPS